MYAKQLDHSNQDPVDSVELIVITEPASADCDPVDAIDWQSLKAFLAISKPFTAHDSFLGVIKNFTPNWYAMTMGTGITAICLNTLANGLPWLKAICSGLWVFNILLFAFFTSLLIARSIKFPESWKRMLNHPTQPMFLGCIPMGLITIVNGFVLFAPPYLGTVAIDIAITLWWIDVVLSLASVLVVPYFMFTRQSHRLDNMTAVWLLPFVACEVAASSGGMLLPHLSADHALNVMVLSLVLWSVSVCLAMGILVIFFQRLCLHKLPTSEVAASIWLPLGPTGTGSLALLLLGNGADGLQMLSAPSHVVNLLQLMPGFGLIGGIIIWALATWWFTIAFSVTVYYIVRGGLKFNLGFWAYTFPLGVYTMATETLGLQTDMAFFKVFGIGLVLSLVAIWLAVFLRTWHGAYHGYLFKDPSLVE
jgi:C4-dicarboxylate transporter/malic acid transport protein